MKVEGEEMTERWKRKIEQGGLERERAGGSEREGAAWQQDKPGQVDLRGLRKVVHLTQSAAPCQP